MKTLITFAAVTAALLTVLGTRLLIPALEIIYYAVLQSWEPTEPVAVAAVSNPVVLTDAEPKAKPRKARRRRPSAATLKAVEALA